MQQTPRRQGAGNEIAGLKARYAALRQAAELPGADPAPLLEAALAELDAAVAALTPDGSADEPGDGGQGSSGASHAERRLLHAVFQQAPVPMFLLGSDGTVRRVNAAAGDLLGSGPGYATGKAFSAFIDLPSRAAAATHLAAAARKGETRQFRCGLLTAAGAVDHALAVHPVSTQGNAAHLVVAVTSAHPAPAGRRGKQRAEPGAEVVQAMTRRLDLVMAATRILLENITYSEPVALQRYARLLARELATWVIVDVEGGQRLRRQHVSGPEDQRAGQLANAVAAVDPTPGSGPYQVHESGSTLLIAHAEDTGALGDGPGGVPLLMQLGSTSVLSVPLSDGEHAYGVLTLARWAGHPHFEIADVGLVEELGEQLALAIRVDRMFRHRVDIADALQTSLLPRQVRQIPGTEIAGEHVAATMTAEAGGDFYDVYPSRDGWGIAIGDVCGTGPDTAAVTAAARHAIRALAHLDSDPKMVLRGINDIMLTEDFGGRFVTADAGHLSWREGRLHLSLSSAGHPGPVLLRPDGRTQVLNGGGLPLGIFPDAEPSTQEVDLETGDVVFLYTDGLTSACGPDLVQFEERLADELAALAGESAAVLVSRIRAVVLELCGGELRDDMTMLALRVGEPV
ncbi:MAG TPA: SpoIIE family protein phosphatase [Streptosporangiaceae bacterium]|nr:SpoIIE family protein phosphatase [Streptosporangiaceae bacterium]